MCNVLGEGPAPEVAVDEIAGLVAAVDRLRGRGWTGRSPAETGAALVELRKACNLLELQFAVGAAIFAASDEYDLQGSVSPMSWIRHECRMSGHAAARAVRVGEQADVLTKSIEALADGRIGFDHLGLLAGTAEALRQSPTATGDFDEEPLLRRALKHSVNRFRHDCAHARHAGDAARFLAGQVTDVEARRLELLPCGDGAIMIRGFLDSIGGATLRTALDPLARRTGVGDDRPRDRRYADALVELAHHRLDAGSIPQRSGQRPHLRVTTTLETLRGMVGAPAGELELGRPIAAATVQRLACDAGVVRVLLGADSAVIDVGRTRRVPSAATRKALEARDKGCVWPGCDRSPSWTAAHHLQHWAHDGATDTANLVLLCLRHHWLIHEGGWQLVRTDQDYLVIRPLQEQAERARAPDLVSA